ncbi:MAG: carotenoid biosynthesis protein [Spirochaetota bacterium]
MKTNSAPENRTAWMLLALMAFSVIASSVIHHCFPSLLQVRSEAVAFSRYPVMFLLDLIPIVLAWLCFEHARRTMGFYQASVFLGGSFFFTGLVENIWVLFGRFMIGTVSLVADGASGTYYYTRGFFWWIETPILICLAWFFLAYSCVYAVHVIAPKLPAVLRAALGGILAVIFDLWLDPVQVSAPWKSWVWLSNDHIRIFSIPLSNFIGWFLMVFVFAWFFERLPRFRERFSPGVSAFLFYLSLLGLAFGIFLVQIAYGLITMRLIDTTMNLTCGGI